MTTNKYWRFLERLRRQSVNVYGMPIDLMKEFGLPRREARKIWQDWVANYNEEIITMFTTLGQLTIKGKNMHISRLSVETGDVEIQGEVCALGYSDNLSKKSSLISKLFR